MKKSWPNTCRIKNKSYLCIAFENKHSWKEFWRDGRVVDCGGLENRCTARYRGFESLSLRKKWVRKHSYPLFLCLYPSIDSPSRNLKTPSRFEVNVSTFLSIPLHLIGIGWTFLASGLFIDEKSECYEQIRMESEMGVGIYHSVSYPACGIIDASLKINA